MSFFTLQKTPGSVFKRLMIPITMLCFLSTSARSSGLLVRLRNVSPRDTAVSSGIVYSSSLGMRGNLRSVNATVVHVYAVADFAAPDPVCAGSLLTMPTPVVKDNGNEILKKGWLLNGEEFNPETRTMNISDNGRELKYYVETICGRVTSSPVLVTVKQAPQIAAIASPSPICSGSTLSLAAPEIINGVEITTAVWQLNGVPFDPKTTPLIDNIRLLTYRVESACGTVTSDPVPYKILQAPEIAAIIPPSPICSGNILSLTTPGITPGASINKQGWQLNGAYIDPSNPLTYADNNKNLTYKVETSCGSFSSDIFKVTVFPTPVVRLPNELITSADEKVTLTPEIKERIMKYQWFPQQGLSCFDCENPVFQSNKNSAYQLTVESADGCVASSSVVIKVMARVMPNAFTPDGNGINDRFTAAGQNIKLVKSFKIYNRSGNLVFMRSNVLPNDSKNGWDGTVNGDLTNQTTTFVYVIEYVANDDGIRTEKGTVILVR